MTFAAFRLHSLRKEQDSDTRQNFQPRYQDQTGPRFSYGSVPFHVLKKTQSKFRPRIWIKLKIQICSVSVLPIP